mmetsp:Transcript_55182/g.123370  ORF Transcript_55182/g.123370 Transcript_55182/m.123370 type:complete len:250 (-) Transcript_55182:349-1098(-)
MRRDDEPLTSSISADKLIVSLRHAFGCCTVVHAVGKRKRATIHIARITLILWPCIGWTLLSFLPWRARQAHYMYCCSCLLCWTARPSWWACWRRQTPSFFVLLVLDSLVAVLLAVLALPFFNFAESPFLGVPDTLLPPNLAALPSPFFGMATALSPPFFLGLLAAPSSPFFALFVALLSPFLALVVLVVELASALFDLLLVLTPLFVALPPGRKRLVWSSFTLRPRAPVVVTRGPPFPSPPSTGSLQSV